MIIEGLLTIFEETPKTTNQMKLHFQCGYPKGRCVNENTYLLVGHRDGFFFFLISHKMFLKLDCQLFKIVKFHFQIDRLVHTEWKVSWVQLKEQLQYSLINIDWGNTNREEGFFFSFFLIPVFFASSDRPHITLFGIMPTEERNEHEMFMLAVMRQQHS